METGATYVLIRLMGRRPLDALEIPEMAELLLACHAPIASD